MATATQKRPASPPASRAIIDPLDRLKRTIRIYVTLEGLAYAVSFACLWFWLVFLMDWGLFTLVGIDYVRDSSALGSMLLRGFLLTVLIGGLAGIVGFKIVQRLVATFREASLALVLERRFPGILGDRLVTAVELSDLRAAEDLGYSRVMLEDTVAAAADRVERVSLGEVFNWKRLLACLGLAVLLFLSVGTVAVLATDDFAIWLERNVLLESTRWPRLTLLDLPEFRDRSTRAVPHGGELRVPIHAWKWVVADRRAPEGWRSLQWADVCHEAASRDASGDRPWELDPPCFKDTHYQALPQSWSELSLDRVEALARLAGTNSSEGQALLTELGLATIEHCRARIRKAASEGRSTLDEGTITLIPAAWRELPLDVVEDYLRASQALTPTEVRRLQGLLTGGQVVRADGPAALTAAFAGVTPPLLTAGLIQKVSTDLNVDTRPLTLSGSDLDQLPQDWRQDTVGSLVKRLQEVVATHSPERLGNHLRVELITLFDELDRRVEQSHLGRRRYFRRLSVPDEVTVEFEQILTDEERATSKAKLGKPRVRRQPESDEFVYDFKKIDRPLRFRVVAPLAATPWYHIDVKPLPAIKKLTRYQEELGYLHGSNTRIPYGPIAVSTEGDESQFGVPSGTRLKLDGECQKPLRWLRVAVPDRQEHHLWARRLAYDLGGATLAPATGSGGPLDVLACWAVQGIVDNVNPHVAALEHEEGQSTFTLVLRELAGDDVRLLLEFEDQDGIQAARRISIAVGQDKEPEFKKAQPEIVKRKMITAQAVIPFSGHIRDDHGLSSLAYELSVESLDRKPIKKMTFPFRRFRPLRLPEPAPEDLGFERRDEVTLRRLLTGPLGEAQAAGMILAQLPQAGALALAQPPLLDVPVDHPFEFRLRAGTEPVLGPDDEFVDTLWLRPAANSSEKFPTPPYRVVIRLVARDNRILSDAAGNPVFAPQETRSPETFEFNVATEEDLLIESGKREEDIRDRCEQIIENLKKARGTILKRLGDDFDNKFAGKDGGYDFRRASADAQDVAKIIRENRVALDVDVVQAFREIYRELVLNRVQEQILERIDRKVCRPLEGTLAQGQHFDRAADAATSLANGLAAEREKTSRILLEESLERTDQLIARLEEIVGEMKKLIEFNQALQVLKELINRQTDILDDVRRKEAEAKKRELLP